MKQLEIINVNKSFKNKFGDPISGLKNINLKVSQGEVIAIIGTNGAGKSTLMNCITGQIPIDSGQIYLNQDRIDQWGQIRLAKYIGRVFQDPNMGTAPRMTVFENLILASKRRQRRLFTKSLTRENYDSMAQYLRKFNLDLENRLDLPIEILSGGQRQIISLLMASLRQPKLLLLDEHTAALDPRTAKQVMEMSYKMIRDLKLTTFMITHHLQDALDFSDRIIVMHQGRIAKEFSQNELKGKNSSDLYQILESLMLDEVE